MVAVGRQFRTPLNKLEALQLFYAERLCLFDCAYVEEDVDYVERQLDVCGRPPYPLAKGDVGKLYVVQAVTLLYPSREYDGPVTDGEKDVFYH